jgi:hypothetical protein
METTRAINASCMYETFDAKIESYNPKCFSKCVKPYNITSDCYLECFAETIKPATQE